MSQNASSQPIGVTPAAGGCFVTAKLMEDSSPAGRPWRPRKKLPTSMAFIDPKPLTRHSITNMLAKAFPGYVTISAVSCEQLLDTQRRSSDWPHFVIVYIRSAGMTDGWVQDELQFARLRLPDAPVIILSDRDDADDVVKALTLGVRGYIPTSIDCEVAFAALSLIYAGGTYIPLHILGSANAEIGNGAEDDRGQLADELDLTHRELAVMHLLREGKSNKLIATALKMQESTVKVHVRNILKKLHVANRTQAASIGNRLLGPHAPTALGLPRPASVAPDRAH